MRISGVNVINNNIMRIAKPHAIQYKSKDLKADTISFGKVALPVRSYEREAEKISKKIENFITPEFESKILEYYNNAQKLLKKNAQDSSIVELKDINSNVAYILMDSLEETSKPTIELHQYYKGIPYPKKFNIKYAGTPPDDFKMRNQWAMIDVDTRGDNTKMSIMLRNWNIDDDHAECDAEIKNGKITSLIVKNHFSSKEEFSCKYKNGVLSSVKYKPQSMVYPMTEEENSRTAMVFFDKDRNIKTVYYGNVSLDNGIVKSDKTFVKDENGHFKPIDELVKMQNDVNVLLSKIENNPTKIKSLLEYLKGLTK